MAAGRWRLLFLVPFGFIPVLIMLALPPRAVRMSAEKPDAARLPD